MSLDSEDTDPLYSIMGERLRPCPSCGGRALTMEGDMFDGPWYWECYDCQTRGKACPTKVGAQRSWNRFRHDAA